MVDVIGVLYSQERYAADQARAEWSAANPLDPMSGSPFWMVGEVFGHGPQANVYQDNGFDALINFAFQGELAAKASDCLSQADSGYEEYAGLLQNSHGHNFMSYASSHDTSLFFAEQNNDLKRQQGLAAALLLSPGAVQIYYGDESARPLGPSGSDPYQGTRSSMNWAAHQQPPIAALLDQAHGGDAYQTALHLQQRKVDDPAQTPSARVLAELRETGESKGYNAAFSPRDRSAFLETLDRLCRRIKK